MFIILLKKILGIFLFEALFPFDCFVWFTSNVVKLSLTVCLFKFMFIILSQKLESRAVQQYLKFDDFHTRDKKKSRKGRIERKSFLAPRKANYTLDYSDKSLRTLSDLTKS